MLQVSTCSRQHSHPQPQVAGGPLTPFFRSFGDSFWSAKKKSAQLPFSATEAGYTACADPGRQRRRLLEFSSCALPKPVCMIRQASEDPGTALPPHDK